MSKVYDKPITIQQIDESTETWSDLYSLHAYINKTSRDNEYLNAGAIQDKRNLTFEVRYFAALEDLVSSLQCYRIVYQGKAYNIVDFDDYKLQHRTVKLVGVSY